MADTPKTSPFAPGFEFMESLMKSATSAMPGMMPGMGQWVAPTLNPEELEKRINELKTVQFWLEQNARLLSTTIQAMEVQRMTLSTLKTMNVQMEDLRDSLKIRMPTFTAPEAPASAPAAQGGTRDPAPPAEPPADETASEQEEGSAPARPAVDPMQWWSALTKQFTDLAATAMKDTGAEAARSLAESMLKPGMGLGGGNPAATEPGTTPPETQSAPKPARKTASRASTKTRTGEAAAAPAARKGRASS